MIRRILAVLALGACMHAAAQVFETPPCDPCAVPGAKAKVSREPPSTGAALRAQVEAKLRASFMAAAPDGRMTRERANAAGLGFIAQNFAAIDRDVRGVVTFEEYKRFLRERGAAID